MLPLLAGGYNPSSVHAHGRVARGMLDAARADVARVLGAAPREIVFTGSGTEADVLAIVGAAKARAADGKHVITSAFEHHAVLHAFDVLEAEGWSVTRLPVDARRPRRPAIGRGVRCVPARRWCRSCSATTRSVRFSRWRRSPRWPTPPARSFTPTRSRRPATSTLDLRRLDVDLLSLSAHKFNGPKGVGVLFVRRGTPVVAQMVGGGQEHGLRSGTENLAGVDGPGARTRAGRRRARRSGGRASPGCATGWAPGSRRAFRARSFWVPASRGYRTS